MWEVNELLVLSDFHLTDERDSGAFRADVELAECLRWARTETRNSTIVLAGDAFDFQLIGQSPAKVGCDRLHCHTNQIVEHHPEVFDALAQLAQSPLHSLVIMSGEGDAELMLPEVREVIERRLGLNFSTSPIRWLVHGEAFRVLINRTVVMIEHGHALDPWNRVDYAGLQNCLALATRNLSGLSECRPSLGSRLISNVIREIRSRYQWADCLRPFNEAVLPLLWAVASENERSEILSLADGYDNMKEVAINKKLSNLHDPLTLFQGEKETEETTESQRLKDWAFSISQKAADSDETAAGNEALNRELIETMRLISARDSFFDVEEKDNSTRYTRPAFEAATNLLIHGHTHSAKAHQTDGGFYLNTGTWSELIRLPETRDANDVWQRFIEKLRKDEIESFHRPTFVRIDRGSTDSNQGQLLEWHSSNPHNACERQHSIRDQM